MKRPAFVLLLLFCVQSSFSQQTEIRPAVRSLVTGMTRYNRIDSEAMGYGGKRTEQYDRFIKFTKLATTDELLLLMDHVSPVVRGYAFWALAKRNYEDLERVYKEHRGDKERVNVMDGCFGGEMPLQGFLIQVVTPRVWDVECKKLRGHIN